MHLANIDIVVVQLEAETAVAVTVDRFATENKQVLALVLAMALLLDNYADLPVQDTFPWYCETSDLVMRVLSPYC